MTLEARTVLRIVISVSIGWSRRWLAPVPECEVLLGLTGSLAGSWLLFWVLKTNSYASRTIQVEEGQKVITSGPYAIVRHPFYAGTQL